MSGDWRWPGARWWKCDFHLHTPASYDFVRRDSVTPNDWVASARAAELDAVAVTDHNTGAYVEQIKTAASDGGRPLVVFPGVELTVAGGIHLLVIFPPERDGDAITALLGKCDIGDSHRGKPEALGQCTFEQAVDWSHERGAICVAAHVDDAKGLLKELVSVTETAAGAKELAGSQTLQRAVKNEHLLAVEANKGDPDLLSFIDNSKADYRRPLGALPVLTFSDAHGLEQIGRRFTWLKMTAPTAEGIRLALLDGEEHSVRRSAPTEAEPNTYAANVVEAIEVYEARYLGRGSPFAIRFNPWLNAVIGGRGTGKSTIVELLRLVADRQAEIPDRLQDEFTKYGTAYAAREDSGLLTSQARLSLYYRKGGARFRIDWSLNDGTRTIYEETHADDWNKVDGEVKQRFPVRIYSQKQVFELAREPLALLRIIDDSTNVDRRNWNEEWREKEAAFLSHRAKVRELEAGLGDEPRLRGELDDVKRKLEVFEAAGHADVLKEYQKRLSQRRAVGVWEDAWADVGQRLREFSEALTPEALEADPFVGEDDVDLKLLAATVTIRERFKAIKEAVANQGGAADSIAQDWRSARSASDWNTAVETAIRAYEALKEKLEAEGVGDPNEYGRLVEERQRLEGRLKALERRRGKIAEERQLADERLTELTEMRRDLSTRRENFLNAVVGDNPYVRIEVKRYGAKETVEGELRRLLARETGGFEKDIGSVDESDGLAADLYGMNSVEEGVESVRARVREIASGGPAAQAVRDKRFAAHLGKLAPEHLDRLDCWFPEDSLEVRYSTSSDGNNFRSIQEGSPGQKTAALLAFLLSYGTEPIILDQPEDDLDNHLIYGLIVTQLKRIKRERQVIVVTHNANIVVNGDAEYVACLDVRGGQTRIVSGGGLQEDEVRRTICDVMEGGEQAFESRYRRIGGRRG